MSLTRVNQHRAWDDHFDRLVAFKAKHGHTLVPLRFNDETGKPVLGAWVQHQRTNALLTDEQRLCLTQLGFDFGNVRQKHDDLKWEISFQKLVAFHRQYQHCRVNQRWKQDRTLGGWVCTQRMTFKRGTLAQDKIERLNSLGFDWELRAGRPSESSTVAVPPKDEEKESEETSPAPAQPTEQQVRFVSGVLSMPVLPKRSKKLPALSKKSLRASPMSTKQQPARPALPSLHNRDRKSFASSLGDQLVVPVLSRLSPVTIGATKALQRQSSLFNDGLPRVNPKAPWFYSDPKGNIQGPFRSEQMRQWLEAGCFRGDLFISQQADGPFIALPDIFPELGVAFKVQQPDRPQEEAAVRARADSEEERILAEEQKMLEEGRMEERRLEERRMEECRLQECRRAEGGHPAQFLLPATTETMTSVASISAELEQELDALLEASIRRHSACPTQQGLSVDSADRFLKSLDSGSGSQVLSFRAPTPRRILKTPAQPVQGDSAPQDVSAVWGLPYYTPYFPAALTSYASYNPHYISPHFPPQAASHTAATPHGSSQVARSRNDNQMKAPSALSSSQKRPVLDVLRDTTNVVGAHVHSTPKVHKTTHRQSPGTILQQKEGSLAGNEKEKGGPSTQGANGVGAGTGAKHDGLGQEKDEQGAASLGVPGPVQSMGPDPNRFSIVEVLSYLEGEVGNPKVAGAEDESIVERLGRLEETVWGSSKGTVSIKERIRTLFTGLGLPVMFMFH